MASTPPTTSKIVFSMYAGLGSVPGAEEQGFNISDQGALNGSVLFKQIYKLAPATTDFAVSLPAAMDSADVVYVQDVTQSNIDRVKVALASGLASGAKIALGQNKQLCFRVDPAATPPTLYLTSGATDTLYVMVVAIGTRT